MCGVSGHVRFFASVRRDTLCGLVAVVETCALPILESSGGIQVNITAGLAGLYAVALFDLARESNAIGGVQKSLAALRQGLTDSADLEALTQSPVISRADAAKAERKSTRLNSSH